MHVTSYIDTTWEVSIFRNCCIAVLSSQLQCLASIYISVSLSLNTDFELNYRIGSVGYGWLIAFRKQTPTLTNIVCLHLERAQVLHVQLNMRLRLPWIIRFGTVRHFPSFVKISRKFYKRRNDLQ